MGAILTKGVQRKRNFIESMAGINNREATEIDDAWTRHFNSGPPAPQNSMLAVPGLNLKTAGPKGNKLKSTLYLWGAGGGGAAFSQLSIIYPGCGLQEASVS